MKILWFNKMSLNDMFAHFNFGVNDKPSLDRNEKIATYTLKFLLN